jgi:hypothetical protein
VIYGAKAEVKVRDIERLGCRITGIVTILYNGEMPMAQIPSPKWQFNTAMKRQGEEVSVPDKVLAKADIRKSTEIQRRNKGEHGSSRKCG